MSLDTKLIVTNFEEIRPRGQEFVAYFYDELFTRYPQARRLFDSVDMAAQKMALLEALALAIENIEKPDVLKDYLLKLGVRHGRYGVEPEHYGWVAEALLATLEEFLGASWTEEAKESWTALYGVIATTMQEGLHSADDEPVEMTLVDWTRGKAREMLEHALAKEVDERLYEMARQRALELLQQAIEDEVHAQYEMAKKAQ